MIHRHDAHASPLAVASFSAVSSEAALAGKAKRDRPFTLTNALALAREFGALPVDMQLVGRRFDEATLLRPASNYGHAVDWVWRVQPPASPHG